MMTEKMVSVVVPCYKDELNIIELVQQLTIVLETISLKWEIIYVNDASPGIAAEILKDVAAKDERIKVINFSRNFGVMSAFHAGMTVATGDAIVIMDGDLQDPPNMIPEFVRKWKEGFMVVYGIRRSRDEVWYRKLGYKYFYKIWKILSDVDIPVDVGEFALIDRRITDIIISMPERNRFLRGIRTWCGFPQVGVFYDRMARYGGKSTQTFTSYLGWSLKAISGFSVKPLRLIFYMTFFVSLSFMFLAGFNVYLYFNGVNAPRGFFTLLLIGLIGSIAQLVALAIISEYLIHIFQEVKGRPQFIVESTINLPKRNFKDNGD